MDIAFITLNIHYASLFNLAYDKHKNRENIDPYLAVDEIAKDLHPVFLKLQINEIIRYHDYNPIHFPYIEIVFRKYNSDVIDKEFMEAITTFKEYCFKYGYH